MQVFGNGVVPRGCASHGLTKAFHVIVNGHAQERCEEVFFLEPLCPGYSSQEMVETCETVEVRDRVENFLQESWLQYAYASFIALWAIFSLMHDWLLMRNASEFLTLQLSCAAAFSQLLAVICGFMWSIGVLKVFEAVVIPDVCACYFVLPELRAILAIVAPCLLYRQSIQKLQQLHRAVLIGDHLHFQTYDVPFNLAKPSGAVEAGSFVLGRAHGYEMPSKLRSLEAWQLRRLAALQRLLLAIFLLPTSLSVALASGPVAVRVQQFVSNRQLPVHLLVLILLGMWGLPVYLFIKLSTLCKLRHRTPKPLESPLPYLSCLGRCFLLILVAAGLLWASLVLSMELLSQLRPTSSKDALLISEAAVLYFALGLQVEAYIQLRPSYQAVLVKAHLLYPPSTYLQVARNPEFHLDSELSLASQFLSEWDGKAVERSVLWQRWQAQLEAFPNAFKGSASASASSEGSSVSSDTEMLCEA